MGKFFLVFETRIVDHTFPMLYMQHQGLYVVVLEYRFLGVIKAGFQTTSHVQCYKPK